MINSLTAIRVLAGTKYSRPVGLYSRNNTKSTVNPNTTITNMTTMVVPFAPHTAADSDAPTLFRRGRTGGWSKRII